MKYNATANNEVEETMHSEGTIHAMKHCLAKIREMRCFCKLKEQRLKFLRRSFEQMIDKTHQRLFVLFCMHQIGNEEPRDTYYFSHVNLHVFVLIKKKFEKDATCHHLSFIVYVDLHSLRTPQTH